GGAKLARGRSSALYFPSPPVTLVLNVQFEDSSVEETELFSIFSLCIAFCDTELTSSVIFFEGGVKLKPNRDPVAEVFPNVNGFDFSLLKILLTDSEPNTNLGGETTAFVGVSEVLDTSDASTVTSEVSSSWI
uniref:Uncharacterized protein n=1 Tax=Crocodylus porosus TaxID=8502 RepID=A0A7M4FB23_CROPO